MAESRDDETVFFIDPETRGIIPLDAPHFSRRLKRRIRQKPYHITINRDFSAVIETCRQVTKTRQNSWINESISHLYQNLHRLGFAHSIEAWQEGPQGKQELVGGLYGLALGGAFFGESMFTRATDASKIALVHLIARLRCGGFTLLDTQFINPHLEQFGAREIDRADFKLLLDDALKAEALMPLGEDSDDMVGQLLHDSTVTS